MWCQPAALWIPQNTTCGSKTLAGVVPSDALTSLKRVNRFRHRGREAPVATHFVFNVLYQIAVLLCRLGA